MRLRSLLPDGRKRPRHCSHGAQERRRHIGCCGAVAGRSGLRRTHRPGNTLSAFSPDSVPRPRLAPEATQGVESRQGTLSRCRSQHQDGTLWSASQLGTGPLSTRRRLERATWRQRPIPCLRSNALMRSRSWLVVLERCPCPHSARRTHLRNVSVVQSILVEANELAGRCESCSDRVTDQGSPR